MMTTTTTKKPTPRTFKAEREALKAVGLEVCKWTSQGWEIVHTRTGICVGVCLSGRTLRGMTALIMGLPGLETLTTVDRPREWSSAIQQALRDLPTARAREVL